MVFPVSVPGACFRPHDGPSENLTALLAARGETLEEAIRVPVRTVGRVGDVLAQVQHDAVEFCGPGLIHGLIQVV